MKPSEGLGEVGAIQRPQSSLAGFAQFFSIEARPSRLRWCMVASAARQAVGSTSMAR
jgi:hypothetical protein